MEFSLSLHFADLASYGKWFDGKFINVRRLRSLREH